MSNFSTDYAGYLYNIEVIDIIFTVISNFSNLAFVSQKEQQKSREISYSVTLRNFQMASALFLEQGKSKT